MIFSITRSLAHWEYYHAPMTIVYRFETQELPRLLNATGYIHLPPPRESDSSKYDEDSSPRIDFSPLENFDLKLCIGKEWHRFPGHFLVPDGVRVEWVKSEFDGMLPGHFVKTGKYGGLLERQKGTKFVPEGLNDLNKEAPAFYVRKGILQFFAVRTVFPSTTSLTYSLVLGNAHRLILILATI